MFKDFGQFVSIPRWEWHCERFLSHTSKRLPGGWNREPDCGHCLWPWSLLFTESSPLAHGARQTARHRRASRKVLRFIQQPTFIRDQLKALRLPSPLPFPELHLQGGCIASSKSCSRRVAPTEKGEISESDRHSAASLSARFINQLHFSSAPHYTSSSLLIFMALWASDVLITVVHGLFLSSQCDAVLFPSRHVNKLMSFILKIRHISLCATWWYVLTGKVESFNVQTMGWDWNTCNKWGQTATFSGRLFVIIEKCFNVFKTVRENRFWLICLLETSSDASGSLLSPPLDISNLSHGRQGRIYSLRHAVDIPLRMIHFPSLQSWPPLRQLLWVMLVERAGNTETLTGQAHVDAISFIIFSVFKSYCACCLFVF